MGGKVGGEKEGEGDGGVICWAQGQGCKCRYKQPCLSTGWACKTGMQVKVQAATPQHRLGPQARHASECTQPCLGTSWAHRPGMQVQVQAAVPRHQQKLHLRNLQ